MRQGTLPIGSTTAQSPVACAVDLGHGSAAYETGDLVAIDAIWEPLPALRTAENRMWNSTRTALVDGAVAARTCAISGSWRAPNGLISGRDPALLPACP